MSSYGAPDNHLVKAILSLLLCCWPLGIVSLVHAVKVDSLWSQGLQDQAKKEAEEADKWANYSILCGVIIGLLAFVIGFISELA